MKESLSNMGLVTGHTGQDTEGGPHGPRHIHKCFALAGSGGEVGFGGQGGAGAGPWSDLGGLENAPLANPSIWVADVAFGVALETILGSLCGRALERCRLCYTHG